MAWSIRTTEPRFGTEVQRLPLLILMSLGPLSPALPNVMVATTLFVAGSILLMKPARWLETQAASGVTVIPSGLVPTVISTRNRTK